MQKIMEKQSDPTQLLLQELCFQRHQGAVEAINSRLATLKLAWALPRSSQGNWEVKTIFITMLRHYLHLSLSFTHKMQSSQQANYIH